MSTSTEEPVAVEEQPATGEDTPAPQPAAEAPGEARGEADGADGSPGPGEADVAALGERLRGAQRQVEEQAEALMRMRAEMDNLRKRTAREVENAHRYGLESFVAELLPVHDSMEMGLGAATAEDADLGRVREGLGLTLKMFEQAAEKFGLREVDPAGEPFDPHFHQAMSMQEAEGVEPGTVVTVVQKGYLLHDRLVRPAMVIVAK